MSYKNLFTVCAIFILFTILSFGFINRIEPVEAETKNNCTYIGSVGTVAYSYCIDPDTGIEFIASSNGYMEIIK